MPRFRVWAPKAARVDLALRGGSIAMDGPDRFGWFRADADAAPGDDYAYRLDGGDPRPDPRSPWQPHGVHGPSRLLDHAAFEWTDSGWQGTDVAGSVVYELHVGTFSPEGTFDGVIPRLGHLLDLGVDTVELLPVAEFPGGRGWGYDGVDLYAPHHGYGGPDGLKRLVDACHAHGLAVILDVVYNHLGPAGNYLGQFGHYFTDRYSTPWGEAVNFDGPYSDQVREFFVDNALMWLRDYHFDGLRLDAVHAYLDTSATHILEQLAVRVGELREAVGRRLFLVAESDLNDPRVVNERSRGGYGIDAQWSDDFHHALHAALTGDRGGYYEEFGSMAALAKSLRQAFVYDGSYSPFRRRRHGRRPEGLPASRFLGYLQNHDQVGNRATGERSSMLVGPRLLKVAAALVLCGPFVPMLFQGEEWGAGTPFLYFTDHDDPELGRLVSEGRRREFAAFGWKPEDVPDPQAEETFASSRLDWNELARSPHAELLDWHRRLIRLRRRVPALCDGRFPDDVRFDEGGRWLVVERGPVTTVANVGGAPVAVAIGDGRPSSVLLASVEGVSVEGGTARLPPESVAVLGRGDFSPEVSIRTLAVRSQGEGPAPCRSREESPMAEYLLSVHMVEGEEPPAPEIVEQMYKDVDVVNQEMKDADVWVFAGGLHPATTATVVRVRDGEVVTTDGPFAETKEQLGGFWVIQVPDLDAALAWAAKATAACRAPVEVRPFQD